MYVENEETSERVLWDFRNTVSKMISENYYGYFSELCHADGLKTSIEPYGIGSLNNIEVGGKADIPMGEFWITQTQMQPFYHSVIYSSHIYGKETASAESFISAKDINWKGYPAMAKKAGDIAWNDGINEFSLFRFAHQANTNVEPGISYGSLGFFFDRTQTWWHNAGAAWFTYMSRGSYLLRQGVPVADLLVFIGDGSPNSILFRKDFQPNIPDNVNFDCVNSEVLCNRIGVKNKKLVLPEGTQYNALVLKNPNTISLKTLKKIKVFADSGVIIIGPKPLLPAGYSNTKSQIDEFEKLSKTIWRKSTTYTDFRWKEIFLDNNIPVDLVVNNNPTFKYIHRRTATSDIYFFSNPDTFLQTFQCQFNIENKVPELWNAINGNVTKLASFTQKNGYTTVPISLNANESVFVVFRENIDKAISVKWDSENSEILFKYTKNKTIEAQVEQNGEYRVDLSTKKEWKIIVDDIPTPLIIDKKWNVEFSKLWNSDTKQKYDTTVVFESLIDWRFHTNPKIKYYSGTATYRNNFFVSEIFMTEKNRVFIDLGEVNIAAKITINGIDFGVLWVSPYKMDITKAVKLGNNDISIEITNTWANRLIGDEIFPATNYYKNTSKNMPLWYVNNWSPPSGKRSTFCSYPFFNSTDNLQPSGLVGPVKILVNAIIKL